jgi:hypothetical protein
MIFTNYTSVLNSKTFAAKELFEQIAFDLLAHFECRPIDPCNALIGQPPADWVIEKSFPLTVHQEENNIEKFDLCSLLNRWSALESHRKRVNKEIAILLQLFKNKDTHISGEIVLIRLEFISETQR